MEDNFEIAIVDIDKTQQICEKLMSTPHYAKMGKEGIYALLAKAKSLNIHPLEALNGGLYYVQGKVGMGAETMNSLIRQRGHSIQKDLKSNDSVCILHGKRADNGDVWTVSFSIEDARRAGLLKNMYEKYPGIMLYNRALSMLARQLFPDVIKGAGYTFEELKEIERSKGHKEDNFTDTDVEVVPCYISQEQADALQSVLNDCDINYLNLFKENLKRMNPPVNAIEEIPQELYPKFLLGAERRRDKFQEHLSTVNLKPKDEEEIA